jgi:hypothetical protein
LSSSPMSSSPHPADFQLKVLFLSQLEVSIAFTWSGVSLGYRCKRSATAPEVNAVASDVPLPRKKRALRTPAGLFSSMYELMTRRPCMCVPGARRSGARHAVLQLAAVAEYEAIWSSDEGAVPIVSAAPTARICGS